MSTKVDQSNIGISSSKAVQYFKPKNGEGMERKRALDNAWRLKGTPYKAVLYCLEEKFLQIQKETNSSLRKTLLQFVKDNATLSARGRWIPTAIVNLGFSIGDHVMFSDFLRSDLRSDSRLCRLSSSTHKTKLDIMASLVDALFDQRQKKELGFKNTRKLSLTYSMIADINCKSDRATVPLLVLIEDLECFDCSLINPLIPVISDNLVKLPVIFIFLVSVTCTSLQNLMDTKATSRLVIHNFDSKPAKQCFDTLVTDSLILAESHFRLGPQVISFIIETFLFYDFSLQKIWSVVKFCIFEHFFQKDYSKLCCSAKLISKQPTRLSEADVKYLEKLPSLKQTKLPTNLNAWRKFIILSRAELMEYHNEFVKSLNSFYTLLPTSRRNPFGNHFRDLYLAAFSDQKLTESQEYVDAIGSLRSMSLEEWEERLACVSSVDPSKLSRDLKKHAERLSAVTTQDVEEDPVPTKSKLDIKSVRNLAELKQKLKENINTNAKKPSKFEVWKSEILHCVKDCLEPLISPLKLPLSELFFYNDVEKLKAHWLASPRTEVMNALREPYNILGMDSGEPDVSTLFELYSQCPATINVKEWLDSFKRFSQKDKCSPAKKRKSEKDDHEIVKRFFASVGDLEQMGFIQAAARKKGDFYTKLVW